jgi:hypothetical protein
MKDTELIEIYNSSNTFMSINKKILKNLYNHSEDIIFNDDDKRKYLLKNYRKIINLVKPVTHWPGDPSEAAIFAKYWGIRDCLPHMNNGVITSGKHIDLSNL